jgi:hypothetical protein
VNTLERDVLEVLGLVRSVKNSFAPINRIPSEVLSLVPDYWKKGKMDQDLIALTHVCRSWREIFTSRPSLWSHLDCRNVEKTRTYVERSKAAPLEIYLESFRGKPYAKDAFFLTAPHIHRLRYLSISANNFPDIISHFFRRVPLLEELKVTLSDSLGTVLSGAFLNEDLSSLRTLSLAGAITHLPRKNLSNLTTFSLSRIPEDRISMTQLLNFFENSPLLDTITLKDSLPKSSDAPPNRIVPLSRLDNLSIDAQTPHSKLLNHLSAPASTLLVLEFKFSGDRSPLLDYLPKPSVDILSRITTINLLFDVVNKFMRLEGPSGEIQLYGHRMSGGNTPPYIVDGQILCSLYQSILSATKRLTISGLKLTAPVQTDRSQVFQTLNSMRNLRSLTLIRCHNLPFILALNPANTPSNHVICPKLKKLVLYIKERNEFCITDMLRMAEERAARGAKLSLVTVVGLGELVPGKEAFKLREHVERVDYRVEDVPPVWHYIHGDES